MGFHLVILRECPFCISFAIKESAHVFTITGLAGAPLELNVKRSVFRRKGLILIFSANRAKGDKNVLVI